MSLAPLPSQQYRCRVDVEEVDTLSISLKFRLESRNALSVAKPVYPMCMTQELARVAGKALSGLAHGICHRALPLLGSFGEYDVRSCQVGMLESGIFRNAGYLVDNANLIWSWEKLPRREPRVKV